jgi:hypothetical protein
MDTELEVQAEKDKLNQQLIKRINEVTSKDPEICKLSGQISILNKWVDSFVQGESKKEVKSKSKQT